MHHLAWCCVTIFSSILVTFFLRSLVNKFARSQHVLTLYDELAGNLVAAVAAMELSVLTYAKHDDIFFYSCFYIFVFMKFLYFSTFELYGSPLLFVDLYYAKDRKHPFTVLECFLIVFTQALGSWLGIVYAKQLWMYGDVVHSNVAEEVCLSQISQTHLWYECFATEMFGTFICAFVDFNMKDSLKLFTRPLMVLFVVLRLGHVTGTWMNPMLATVFTFRCEGHTSDLLHFGVYWIAPLVGLLSAWELHLILKNFFSSNSNEKDVSVKIKDVKPQGKKAKND